jgi:hypothetical protein
LRAVRQSRYTRAVDDKRELRVSMVDGMRQSRYALPMDDERKLRVSRGRSK